jgi:hypothetical protein
LYLDFHLHAFADKIAAKAISTLQHNLQAGGLDDTAYSDGTYAATESYFVKNNFSGVFMPIATKASQMTVVNNWAASVNNTVIRDTHFWSYGSVFPITHNADELKTVLSELDRIKEIGLRGIKLHPDYQQFFIDDENVYPVYEKCAELGLPILFHAGFDPVSPDVTHATPEREARVLDAFPKLTVILAHMGGEYLWDDAEKLICGRDCYIDTAYCAANMDSVQMERMIKKHGVNRVLFGSDFPWKAPVDIRDKINSLNLCELERSAIFYKNALRLLNINECDL